jgi:hypothetical protein
LLGHWLSFNTNLNKIKPPKYRLRTCPPHKPARAKTIRTIGNLLIEMLLLPIIASQTNSVKIKNAEVA